jgi:AcrR family transcriptional regulator
VSTAPARIPRRELILEHAARLFGERGYTATTINDIGDAVGITGPGLYRHFESKQAVLVAIAEIGYQEFLASAEAILRESPRGGDALERLVEMNVRFILGHRDINVAYWAEWPNLGEGERTIMALLERDYTKVLRRALRLARPGLAAPDVAVTAQGVLWFMRSTCFVDSSLGDDRLGSILTRMILGAMTQGS